MTAEEIQIPLTKIEMAELLAAARRGLTESGQNLLRRLLFQCERAATITVMIGNSDDKLPQRKWAEYVTATHMVLSRLSRVLHFYGTSNTAAAVQNACWCLEIENLTELRPELELLAKTYGQDSIALVAGTTELIEP